MLKEFRKDITWGGRALSLQSGKIARQADGAVLATLGETKVLCTVVYEKTPKASLDFFPLSVHYQEKSFAAGKIPGGFFKREGRPAEKEILTSRLIDRPIRPLFAKGYRNETQVICTVLSHDLENDPDIVALVGTSAALTLSGVPFLGPVAGVPGRLHQRRICAEPAARRVGVERSRPGRGRDARGRADGRVRGEGALGGDHAGSGDVRPPQLPACHRRHHRPWPKPAPRSRWICRRCRGGWMC